MRYESLDAFVAEHASNLSVSGMFVVTENVRAEGTMVCVAFELEDGERLIEGVARVARVNPRGGETPRGMGLEFVDLDSGSVALIERIVAKRL